MALSIDQLNAVATQAFDRGSIEQQVYDNTAILDRINKGFRIIKTGGNQIQFPIRYSKLGDATTIDPDAARVTTHYETRTGGVLDWKFAKVDPVITWEERVKVRGDAEIINLVKDKLVEARSDLSEVISTQFYQARASMGGYDMRGFYDPVQTTASASTYASISSGDAASWIAGLYDTSTTTLALYGTGSLEAGIRACWFIDMPDLIVTTRTLLGIYSSKLQPGERRRPMEGSAGATDVSFYGIPFLIDAQCGAGDILFLNTKNMYFYVQEGEAFDAGPWTEDPDRYKATRQLITVVGNFVFKVRKQFGAYTAITS